MKIKLPKILQFKAKPPATVEIGSTGMTFFGRSLAETEYNPDLQGERAIEVYEKMRRSDGQVRAALLTCELPLRAAQWSIEAASEEKQDQQIADFVRQNLFYGMSITFDDFLRHILLMLPFGFSVFEKVWELRDGKYRWRKFAPRLAQSILDFRLDEQGGLEAVQQGVWQNGGFQTVDIPVEKLLVFSYGREGSNYRGISLLRAAYKHWFYKDQLYRIDGISAQRHGIGLAVFHYPPGMSDKERDKLDVIGQHLHAHERAYIALSTEIDFDLKSVTGRLHDILGSIEHHDLQIVRSVLAQFINLGSTQHGSFALSQDQSSFFLMALQAVGRGICDTFNRYAIQQLVDYNWQVETYPRLVVSGMEQYDVVKYSEAVGTLVKDGIITFDEDVENELRRRLHLRARQESKVQAAEQQQTYSLVTWQPRRELIGAEQSMAFAEIVQNLDQMKNRIIQVGNTIRVKQTERLLQAAIPALKARDIEAIGKLDVPYHSELAQQFTRALVELYLYGRRQVRAEARRQRRARAITLAVDEKTEPLQTEEEVMAYLDVQGRVMATNLSIRLRAALMAEMMDQMRAGVVDEIKLTERFTRLSERTLLVTAGFSVMVAFNLGREYQAKEMADRIMSVVYSAVMDEGTCSACAPLDGKEYLYPSAEWAAVVPPNPECAGGGRCRCVGVYVFAPAG